jgi:hypothetical protein
LLKIAGVTLGQRFLLLSKMFSRRKRHENVVISDCLNNAIKHVPSLRAVFAKQSPMRWGDCFGAKACPELVEGNAPRNDSVV